MRHFRLEYILLYLHRISVFTQNLGQTHTLSASDYCIIPVQSHFLASEGIPDVLDMVRSVLSSSEFG